MITTFKSKSKRFSKDMELAKEAKKYSIEEAIELLKKFSTPKFNATVELHLYLNIDPANSDHNVRGSLSLPHGIGKERKILVFADGEEAEQAKKAGADYVGMNDLVEKIQKGWLEFDVALAIPRAMKTISKLGRILGPRGMMPSPKNGTLTEEIELATNEFKKGKIDFKNDKNKNVHVPVGKIDFPNEKLVENIRSFVEDFKTMRPQSVKGIFVKNAYICHTMSPSIELDITPF